MNTVKRFEDLKIWQTSLMFAKDIYLHTANLKDYYLRDQINRAALSISNNIAEGFEYNNDTDFLRFLRYAKGSCGEVRNMLYFLKGINQLSEEEFKKFSDEVISVSRQIMALIKYIKKDRKEKSAALGK